MCTYGVRKGYRAVEVKLAKVETKDITVAHQEGETDGRDNQIG